MRSLLSEWERHRKADAALQLTPLRDDLDWLLAGEPDPDVSIDFWVLCTDETSAAEISRHLLNFSNNYLSTFLLSGWVDAFIGRIIVKDKDLGQAFIKEFWKKSRPAHGRVRAYQALVLVKGGHRDHWLNATSWMQNFRKRSHSDREKDLRFIGRALEKYLHRADYVRCACLPDKYLKQIAATVLDHPRDASRSKVCTDALAKVFRISPSTLTHVRADIKKWTRREQKATG
jgi:hypothetical protein